jgi:ABC-2 type transport system permease protein
MTALFRGELIKAVTTRTLAGYAAAGVALTIANVVIVTQFSGELHNKREALAGMPILLLLFGLVGGAGEYRHGTAAPAALAAGRDRMWLLLARTGAYAVTGLALGMLMVAVSLALGLPLLAAKPGPGLSAGDVVGVAGGSLVAGTLSAIIGVGAGALVRNQVGGVIGALILAFVVNALIGNINESAAEYTPFGSAAVLAASIPGDALTWSGAALVLAAWTAPLLIGAIAAERRRDLA